MMKTTRSPITVGAILRSENGMRRPCGACGRPATVVLAYPRGDRQWSGQLTCARCGTNPSSWEGE